MYFGLKKCPLFIEYNYILSYILKVLKMSYQLELFSFG